MAKKIEAARLTNIRKATPKVPVIGVIVLDPWNVLAHRRESLTT